MPVKGTTRSKKDVETPSLEETGVSEVSPSLKTTAKADPFATLIKAVSDLQSEFERLQKEMAQTKEAWTLEQKAHQQEIEQRNSLEELNRKRDQETYEYEIARRHKKDEDEFADKKTSWEKSLNEQQETLEGEKTELLELRRLVTGFDNEKEKAVAEAQDTLQKDHSFPPETVSKNQEKKSSKEV